MPKYKTGWRDEVIPAYEEGGEAIGRALMYDNSKESYYWALVSGLGLWPRWYLSAFKTLYRERNKTEMERVGRRQRRHRDKMRRREERLRSSLPGPVKMPGTKPKKSN